MTKKPILFVIGGTPGSGKSTAAEIIAQKFKAKIFTTDKIRRTKKFKKLVEPYLKTGKFFPWPLRQQFYQDLFEMAKKELTAGRNVILDATFSNQKTRQVAYRLAKKTKAKLIPIELSFGSVSAKTIYQRMKKRITKDKKAALPKVHFEYKRHYSNFPKDWFKITNQSTKIELKNKINKLIKSF